tara:strand:- start:126 stop:800 length:675 start_codon:yes stop_codon:yes gene_type:complete
MSKNKNEDGIILIGGGGFALEVYSYICDDKKYKVKGIIDETKECELINKHNELKYLGDIKSYKPKENDFALICVGNAFLRRKLYFECKKIDLKLTSYIHSTSHISSNALIGDGVFIGPHCIISSHAIIKNNIVLNVYCGVGHGANIKDHSVMSPYSVINGDCSLGEGVFLGSRVTLNPKIKIGDFSLIDAGSIIREDIDNFSIVSQRPQQIINENRALKREIQK